MSRDMRHPQHQFYVRQEPWAIQPVAIAPVLPGDTLKQCRVQARIVTDPVSSKLLPWWAEMHLFYVKHRDLDAYNSNTAFQSMVLDPANTHASAGTVTGGGTATYRLHGRKDYTLNCLQCVTDWWFRDEGDTSTEFVTALSGLPMIKYGRQDWMDSLMRRSDVTSPDFSVDIDSSGTIMASEIEQSMMMWEVLKSNQLTDMTYEDFLATYGVHTPRAALNRPERLWSWKDFSHPTNTVSQGTGAVSSAIVWSMAETSKKDRFFKEPGFLLMVAIARPKVYRRRQPGAAVNLLDNAYLWLPGVLRDDPNTSLTVMDTVSGGVPSVGLNSVQADMRDLFVYGDQFLACAPTVTGGDTIAAAGAWSANGGQLSKFGSVLGLTATTARPDYPLGTLAERQDIFVGQTAETSLIEVEGVVSFSIAGTVVDQTPGVPVRA